MERLRGAIPQPRDSEGSSERQRSERVSIKKFLSIASGIGLEALTSIGCLSLSSVSNFLLSWIPS
jgi:hypothetical protein